MEREKINEWIVRYNEGTLDGEELEMFLRMLEHDEELRREVSVDQEINRVLEEKDLLELRKAILEARKRRGPGLTGWFLLAAVLIILLAVGGAILARHFMAGRPEVKPAMTLIKKDSAVSQPAQEPAEHKEHVELIADNYKPFPSLESLVGEATRADGIKVEEPKPVSSVNKGQETGFKWITETAANVEVQLFDNKGTRITIAGIKEPGGLKLATTALQPGLYYWKILMNGELVTVGKLRVE